MQRSCRNKSYKLLVFVEHLSVHLPQIASARDSTAKETCVFQHPFNCRVASQRASSHAGASDSTTNRTKRDFDAIAACCKNSESSRRVVRQELCENVDVRLVCALYYNNTQHSIELRSFLLSSFLFYSVSASFRSVQLCISAKPTEYFRSDWRIATRWRSHRFTFVVFGVFFFLFVLDCV